MAKINLDLGSSTEERYGGDPVSRPDSYQEKQYPRFTVYVDLEDFPREGRMTIDYKITRSVETEEENGKERCEYTVEVQKIVEADKVISPASANSTGDILDALAKALHKSSDGDEQNDLDGETY